MSWQVQVCHTSVMGRCSDLRAMTWLPACFAAGVTGRKSLSFSQARTTCPTTAQTCTSQSAENHRLQAAA